MRTKRERVAEIFRRVAAAPGVATDADAFALICDVTNSVEDEMSGQPYDAKDATTMARSARLYPPLPDSEIPSMIAGVRRYLTRGHLVAVSQNGAIEIRERLTGALVLSKPGADGNEVPR